LKLIFLGLPCISLYYNILVLLVSFYNIGIPGEEVLVGYGWEENRMVHNELVRILDLDNTRIGAGSYSHVFGLV